MGSHFSISRLYSSPSAYLARKFPAKSSSAPGISAAQKSWISSNHLLLGLIRHVPFSESAAAVVYSISNTAISSNIKRRRRVKASGVSRNLIAWRWIQKAARVLATGTGFRSTSHRTMASVTWKPSRLHPCALRPAPLPLLSSMPGFALKTGDPSLTGS